MRHQLPLYILAALLVLSPVSWGEKELQQQINELNKTIQEKNQSRDSFKNSLSSNETKIRELNSDILSLEIEIKQLDREELKINVLSGKQLSESDKASIHKINYKRRVAEINLEKKQQQLETLEKDQASSSERVVRLDKLISTMNAEIQVLNEKNKAIVLAQSRQAKIEKNRALALKRQQQKVKEKQIKEAKLEIAAQEKAQKKTLEKTQEKIEQDNKQIQQAQISELSRLPAAAKSALTKAKSRARKNPALIAKLGEAAVLEVSNPIGSAPKPAATMQHLGNNQYIATVKVSAGKQHFIIGGFKFTQNIANHLDGYYFLVIVDATKARPSFDMLIAGK